MMRPLTLLFILALLLTQCKTYNPHHRFDPKRSPAPPDYTLKSNWAALPERFDAADQQVPGFSKDRQDSAQVDVFFLHPTILTGERRGDKFSWNGRLDDADLNKATDDKPIAYQASAFNNAGRVYAPRYRQAHLYSFYTKDKQSAAMALDTAYTDINAAFRHYMKHWNQGRPFIIAAHSQGARHAMYLIRDEIEGTELMERMVVAYIVGWPVEKNFFKQMPPCQTPDQTNCFCSWRTYERNYGKKHAVQDSILCTNPILWTTRQQEYAPKSLNKGAVVRGFTKTYMELCDAEVYRGVVLCTKPKFPGSALLRTKNYHPGDINLYYFNVRENATQRAAMFLKR